MTIISDRISPAALAELDKLDTRRTRKPGRSSEVNIYSDASSTDEQKRKVTALFEKHGCQDLLPALIPESATR